MSFHGRSNTRRAHARLAEAMGTASRWSNSPMLPTNSTLMPSCLTPLPSLTLTSTYSGSTTYQTGYRDRQQRRRVSRPHLASQSRRCAHVLQSGVRASERTCPFTASPSK